MLFNMEDCSFWLLIEDYGLCKVESRGRVIVKSLSNVGNLAMYILKPLLLIGGNTPDSKLQ